jgi:hypothetical protein
LPRTTSQQSPGVLCCATSLSEKPLPARTTGGSLRCDALLPSGGMLALYDVWRATQAGELYRSTGCQKAWRAQRSAKSSEGAGFNLLPHLQDRTCNSSHG